MKLPDEDVELFYKLHPALLFYTNQQKGVAKDVTTIEDFMELPVEEKVHARTFGRRLSKIGLRGAWFAILEGEIVAGGSTRAEVEQILGGIIPKEKRNFVYVFRLRGK
uniref:DUF5678 domain-containing protein n=1 Tax=Candidatus Methanophagaceae archaeon ANME-1 ERB6 TaxID=2759912 RepID=A0A7G9YX44_9EURY|nr:hypothetical protein NBNHMHLL_00010 [Methanosarcinales archaeon ANME-1 ERB6]